MSIVCPTITAGNLPEYKVQANILKSFAKRVHIDLADSTLTENALVELSDISLPDIEIVDIHLMTIDPLKYLDKIIKLKPSMLVIHSALQVDYPLFAAKLHRANIKAGLAILPQIQISEIEPYLTSFDHLLIFSGNLGHFGGQADLNLLSKIEHAKMLHPELEFGWDGGINDQNISKLSSGDVDVLNVGGYIQKSTNPEEAYKTLSKLLL